jgi:hypothetical protein
VNDEQGPFKLDLSKIADGADKTYKEAINNPELMKTSLEAGMRPALTIAGYHQGLLDQGFDKEFAEELTRNFATALNARVSG